MLFLYFLCLDIDECAENRYSCPAYSQCHNDIGGYHCTCNEGYEESGQICTGKSITVFEQSLN